MTYWFQVCFIDSGNCDIADYRVEAYNMSDALTVAWSYFDAMATPPRAAVSKITIEKV
jgi:hypothetical protein